MAFVQDRRFISPRYGATPESSLGQTSSSFRRDLALLDNEIDFLTGSPASTLTLEMAHLLNTVRSDPDRRNIIERFLSSLRIVHDDQYEHAEWCSLNSAANVLFLRPDFHTALDFAGEFLIVAFLDDLNQAIQELNRANRIWDADCKNRENAVRTINFRLPCFTETKFEVLVMQAHLGDRHTLRARLFEHHGRSILYTVDSDLESLVPMQVGDPTFVPFPAPPTDRTPCQRINILLLTLHNASRLRTHHLDRDRMPIHNARSMELQQAIRTLEDEIVYIPSLHTASKAYTTVKSDSRNLGRITKGQKQQLKMKAELWMRYVQQPSKGRSMPNSIGVKEQWRHPGAAAFYDALPKPGELLEDLDVHLDLPEAPVVIDLPEHEVAALRDKQEADWELEMTR